MAAKFCHCTYSRNNCISRSSETMVMSRGRSGISKSGLAKGALAPIRVTPLDDDCLRTRRRLRCSIGCSELPAGAHGTRRTCRPYRQGPRPRRAVRWHACAHALRHVPDLLQDRLDQALVVADQELLGLLVELGLVDEEDLLVARATSSRGTTGPGGCGWRRAG